MAAGETPFTILCRSQVVLCRERAQVSRIKAYRDGALVVPSAADYELLDAGGNVISDEAPSIAVDGTVSVNIPALDLPSTLAFGEQYQERWILTLGGIPRTVRRIAILARFELHPPVSEEELVAGEYPDLVEGLGDYGTTLQPFMDTAWAECLRWLWRQGTPSDLLVDASEVYDWYRHTVLLRVFKLQAKMQPGDRIEGLWRYHEEKATAARQGAAHTVDRDRSGLPDSYAREPAAQVVHVNVMPRRRLSAPHKF